MVTFNPPRRATITPKNTAGLEEQVYIHGIDDAAVVVEHRQGFLEVLNYGEYSIVLDPNTGSKAEAMLRNQGMDLARIPSKDERK